MSLEDPPLVRIASRMNPEYCCLECNNIAYNQYFFIKPHGIASKEDVFLTLDAVSAPNITNESNPQLHALCLGDPF
jgi:hypothetical protein